ncbi:DUF2867 domain-containing protein [Rhodoferax sp. AJA081-3]|uniref:DUF2867 domain-containing protein n=1 Tax=Rhodoferax sp. AJA081-3 TaxID=2752316 RepID=UPI001ADFD7EE|nr:DUF2867 domain-containing protein [Rhodoferax sp. AJA081-3]QTN27835.1 DUF2867 domain-containing protein [Rhodoferax sp. AJA081-3]
MKPVLCDIPAGSRIAQALPNNDFADCYQFDDLWPNQNALETYLTLVTRTPGWMNALMAMRNQAVRLVGLKHVGNLSTAVNRKPAKEYKLGDRVGIFSIQHLQDDEVVVFDDDKHLHVQLSVVKHVVDGKPKVSLSTVVHIHNRLGRVYMAVVGPVHSLIVPRMLAQVAHA